MTIAMVEFADLSEVINCMTGGNSGTLVIGCVEVVISGFEPCIDVYRKDWKRLPLARFETVT